VYKKIGALVFILMFSFFLVGVSAQDDVDVMVGES